MNEEQVKSAVRWVITTFGGMFAGWFAAKGWFTIDQINSVLNGATIPSVIASGIMLLWGLFVHKQSNAVAVVNNMPEVAGVITVPTAAGNALAAAVPVATVAPAGTTAAKDIAVAKPV